ncbi:hypothetical protein [Pseudoduganella armeniaca]|uniref:hypothetical protein n=1 Tax=Pseudoduganella armeniaca TaxID=2072590 RepID=UPI0015E64FC1|nr:hypothetical protein [Pseudoduganella armeniaca]
MAALSLDSAIDRIKALNIRNIVTFIGIFSVLMGLLFPALRYVYTTLLLHAGIFRHSTGDRTRDQKQLSNWAAGTVAFAVWNLCSGALVKAGDYRGYLLYVATELEKNSLVSIILVLGLVSFILFCLTAAFDREC